jgi:hypothetical protein
MHDILTSQAIAELRVSSSFLLHMKTLRFVIASTLTSLLALFFFRDSRAFSLVRGVPTRPNNLMMFFVFPGLLATTLFTFQDYACDNEQLRIRCPRGSTISVRWAQYGRLATSNNNDLCPAVTWQPLPKRHDTGHDLSSPSPRTDWVVIATNTTAIKSSSSASLPDVKTTTAMTPRHGNSSSQRLTCLASTSLQVGRDGMT